MDDMLRSRSAITKYMQRDWRTVKRWIEEEGFPARQERVGGNWMASKEECKIWWRQFVTKNQNLEFASTPHYLSVG